MAERGVPATLDEMRAIVAQFPGPDQDAADEAAAREAQLTKPEGALGRLEEITQWMATWQGKHPPICASTKWRSKSRRRISRKSRR
jgi:nicotinate-nucleotide--dimethylbenzimidazole phosphoribosyltransferase